MNYAVGLLEGKMHSNKMQAHNEDQQVDCFYNEGVTGTRG